jgi:predicted transcriptional regulator
MAVAHKIAPPKATRKNFTMPDETARELDFLATLLHKKQSQVIQELIHNASTALRNDMRLAKLKQLKGAFTGLIGDEQSIQRMKSERTL